MKLTKDLISLFMKKPHIFGHYLGYNDLIDLHSEWIYDAWINRDVPSMQAHRNSYKTTAILIVGAIWHHIFINPDSTVLFIRKAETDAQRIVETIINHFESKEVLYLVNELFGIKSLQSSRWSKSSIVSSLKRSKTPEGSFDAKGTTGAVTGSHYDFIFPDDIISLKDRVSPAERDWIKNFIRELKKIVKHGGKIFYSGTPWHKDDGWSIIPEPKKYPIGTVPIKGYTEDVIQQKINELRTGDTPSLFAANYELRHIIDEGRIFTDPIYGKWPIENIKRMNAFIDPAYEGTNTTSLSIIAETKEDNKYLRGWVWRRSIVELYETITKLLIQYQCGTVYNEINADQGLSTRDLKTYYPNVQGIRTTMNKHVKITGFLLKRWNEIIIAEDCQPEYINQILDYQEGQEPDDAPDGAAALIKQMFGTVQEFGIGIA